MNIKSLFKYRSVWIGISIMLVLFGHLNTVSITLFQVIRKLCINNSCAVEIFIFASGIGCYYSYNKDKSPIKFLKRRIYRLAPIYLPVILIWIIYALDNNIIKVCHIFGNIFGIQEFTALGNAYNWFIGAIVLFYILTPYFVEFADRNSNRKCFILFIFLLCCTTMFWNNYNLIVIALRLPVFYLGILIAKNSDLVLDKKKIILLLVFYVIGVFLKYYFSHNYNHDDIMWYYGLYWYPNIIMVPFICCVISLFSGYIEKIKGLGLIIRKISKIGNISFEIYLTHIFVYDVTKRYMNIFMQYINNENIIWIIAVVLSLILAIGLNKVSGIIKNKFFVLEKV